MVSLQAYLSQGDQRIVMSPNFETTFSNSNKRKWQETGDQHQNQGKQSKRSQEQVDDIELSLDAPLPLEWQRCLDIKSGQIHFYNSWTHKRTSKDPRLAPEPRPPSPSLSLSLDLELNLSSSSNHVVEHDRDQVQPKHDHQFSNIDHQHKTKSSSSSSSSSCSPSWISLDVDRQEMVAAVCMRCHMLVMMCKATPSCPNCKFVHPQGQGQGQATSASSSSSLISNNKPAGLRLLCCKD